MSGANFCRTSSYTISLESNVRIESQEDSLTILGFAFGTRPDASAHVSLIKKKFGARSWIIRQLRQLGVDPETMIKVYTAIIRSVIEYAVPAFHSLLTSEQDNQIERMQKAILKTNYGDSVPYADALERSGLASLRSRREAIIKKFASKALSNPRISDRRFPVRNSTPYQLRRRDKIYQERARTDRLKYSPLYTMRNIMSMEGALNKWIRLI